MHHFKNTFQGDYGAILGYLLYILENPKNAVEVDHLCYLQGKAYIAFRGNES